MSDFPRSFDGWTGEKLLEKILEAAKAKGTPVSGQDAFLLYDTYGFPLEITQEAAAERNIAVQAPSLNPKPYISPSGPLNTPPFHRLRLIFLLLTREPLAPPPVLICFSLRLKPYDRLF